MTVVLGEGLQYARSVCVLLFSVSKLRARYKVRLVRGRRFAPRITCMRTGTIFTHRNVAINRCNVMAACQYPCVIKTHLLLLRVTVLLESGKSFRWKHVQGFSCSYERSWQLCWGFEQLVTSLWLKCDR